MKRPWLSCWPIRVQQVLPQRWIWESIVQRPWSMKARESTLASKSWADVTRTIRQVYHWPHKKDLCPSVKKIKKTTLPDIPSHYFLGKQFVLCLFISLRSRADNSWRHKALISRVWFLSLRTKTGWVGGWWGWGAGRGRGGSWYPSLTPVSQHQGWMGVGTGAAAVWSWYQY